MTKIIYGYLTIESLSVTKFSCLLWLFYKYCCEFDTKVCASPGSRISQQIVSLPFTEILLPLPLHCFYCCPQFFTGRFKANKIFCKPCIILANSNILSAYDRSFIIYHVIMVARYFKNRFWNVISIYNVEIYTCNGELDHIMDNKFCIMTLSCPFGGVVLAKNIVGMSLFM